MNRLFTTALALLLPTMPAQLFAEAAKHASRSSDPSHSQMLTVPACPVGGSEQFTKNLQINYLPGKAVQYRILNRLLCDSSLTVVAGATTTGQSFSSAETTVAGKPVSQSRFSGCTPFGTFGTKSAGREMTMTVTTGI